jgi:3-methyladenine DNA glycosylase AlkD
MKSTPASKPAIPGVEAAARRIIRDLWARRDSARADGVQRYFKNAVAALGIDAPTLWEYARGELRRLKPAWTVTEAMALCDRLLAEKELEIRVAGILILGGFRKEFGPGLLPQAKRWLESRLDNWALVDGFCSAVLSPLFDRHPAAEQTLRRWSGALTLWARRAALVTLVPIARRGKHLGLAYELAGEHFGDDEDLMHKATGWLLREAGKTDMPRLKTFLLRHGPAIPRTAVRYAIERFPVRERKRLLELTRRAGHKNISTADRRGRTQI